MHCNSQQFTEDNTISRVPKQYEKDTNNADGSLHMTKTSVKPTVKPTLVLLLKFSSLLHNISGLPIQTPTVC